MTLKDLLLIEEALNKISSVTNTDVEEIIDELTGVAWSEEDASRIKEFVIEALK